MTAILKEMCGIGQKADSPTEPRREQNEVFASAVLTERRMLLAHALKSADLDEVKHTRRCWMIWSG